MSSLDSFTEYARTPIQIHSSACILIRLFTGFERFEDCWTVDIGNPADHRDVYDYAAEQFIKQLEGHDCIAFHQALIRACQKRVDEWKERCNADSADEHAS